MRTKVTLAIGAQVHDLTPDCLKNWEDVACAYKRSDYSGIVRSFTSKFEFCGDAYDVLVGEYLLHRYGASVVVAVHTMNDDFTFTKRFECPLDFSTVQIENGVFSVSAIDNSLAAIIKANKGTKYEFKVGDELTTDGNFIFDRICMNESVTYAFTSGDGEDDSAAINILISSADGPMPWLGSVASEIAVNGSIYFCDDQETGTDTYMLEAHHPVTVNLDGRVVVDTSVGSGPLTSIVLQHIDAHGNQVAVVPLCEVGGREHQYVGVFASVDALCAAYPEHSGAPGASERYVAVVDGYAWYFEHNGSSAVWVNTHYARDEYRRIQRICTAEASFDMGVGDKLRAVAMYADETPIISRIVSSSITFTWLGRGTSCEIAAHRPANVLDHLLSRLCDGQFNAFGRISSHDPRLADTIVMAAESIRGLDGAKLYSSFNDFCDWMEAVFGYTYYLGDKTTTPFASGVRVAADFGYIPYPNTPTAPPSSYDPSQVRYIVPLGTFVLCTDEGCFQSWTGSNEYNDPVSGMPKTDRLFNIGGKLYFFVADDDGNVDTTPKEYLYSESNIWKPHQEVVFVHRSELFDADASVKKVANAKELRHSVNASAIYSSVEIGYDKKDYDSVNGRDEFNFNQTYTTGCTVSSKKLSLMSKYRADCYGIEFAAQKRGKESTDSDSDESVFFVLAAAYGRNFTADRSTPIEGVLSDTVFNADFSPAHCIAANAGYIGMQADSLTLKFASAKGNSDAVIDGQPLSRDIVLDTPLMTTGELEFVTDDDTLPRMGDLVATEKDGLRYEGYISEIEEHYAREEAVKYKLLVKSIEIC